MSKIVDKSKVQDASILRETFKVAEYMYSKLHEFSDDEKWGSAHKIRSSASDLLFVVAQAVGNASPAHREYDWGNARKHALALRTMYAFACKQHFIELEPEIMVKLDKLIEEISTQTKQSYDQTEIQSKEDIEEWRKKYKISKEIES